MVTARFIGLKLFRESLFVKRRLKIVITVSFNRGFTTLASTQQRQHTQQDDQDTGTDPQEVVHHVIHQGFFLRNGAHDPLAAVHRLFLCGRGGLRGVRRGGGSLSLCLGFRRRLSRSHVRGFFLRLLRFAVLLGAGLKGPQLLVAGLNQAFHGIDLRFQLFHARRQLPVLTAALFKFFLGG